MPSEKYIVEAFDKVAAEVPGYTAAALVDLESGMTLGPIVRNALTKHAPSFL